ncbi:MAG: hypothetical protein U0Y68_04545 [Blastocatellia bacterium]
MITAYSLMALIRVVLRVPSGGAFGGWPATSLILIVYLTSQALPRLVARWAMKFNLCQQTAPAIHWLVAAEFGSASRSSCLAIVIGKTFPVLLTAPHGSLCATSETAPAAQEAIHFLQANSTAEDAIAVLPEGVRSRFSWGDACRSGIRFSSRILWTHRKNNARLPP